MPVADRRRPTITSHDEGAALVMVLMVAAVGLALTSAMFVVADVEVTAAAAHRDGVEALHAAESAVEAAIDELATISDWSMVLSGAARSRFHDLTSPSTATIAGTLDVGAITAALQALSDARSPWGANNPRWRLYALGPIGALIGTPALTGPHLMVWVADDESESDGDPMTDVNGVVRVRAEARGRRGSRRLIEAVVARTATAGVTRLISWRETQ